MILDRRPALTCRTGIVAAGLLDAVARVARHRVARALGLALSVLAVGVLAFRLRQHVGALAELAAAPDVQRLVASLGLLLLSYAVQARVWRTLAQAAGTSLPWDRAFGVLYLAQIGKYLPGLVWGYLGALHWGERAGVPVRAATYAQTGLVVVESVAALFLGAVVIGWLMGVALPLLAALAVLLGIAAWLLTALTLRWLARVAVGPECGHAPVGALFGWVGLHWLAFAFGYWLLLSAFWPVGLAEAALMTALHAAAWLVGYWTIVVPSGLGVRELVQASLLMLVLPAPLAVAVPLVTRVWLTVGDALACVVAALVTVRRAGAAAAVEERE